MSVLSSERFLELLEARAFSAAFQPVVDLRNDQVVGFEALARAPEGEGLESASSLLAMGRAQGRLGELDWNCRTSAFKAFLDAHPPASLSLFVNIEAESLSTPCPSDMAEMLARAETSLRVFVEVNDRALAADPAALMAAVDRARELGWGVAIDDIGASRGCLALLPLIRPDVVKLDLQLLAAASPEHEAAVVTSVLRYVEEASASLLVEGIESGSDAKMARTLGASYGQGHHLGKPSALPDQFPVPRFAVPVVGRPCIDSTADSPFDLVGSRSQQHMEPQRMNEDEFARLVHIVANQGAASSDRPLVMASLGPSTAECVDGLRLFAGPDEDDSLVVLFGSGLTTQPRPGVRGVRVPSSDVLARERFLIVLTERSSAALLARRPVEAPHLLDVVMTQNSETVYALTRSLIPRIPPPGPDNAAVPAVVSSLLPAPGDEPAEVVDATGLGARARAWVARNVWGD